VPDDQTPRSATCKPEPPAVSTSLFRRQAIEHMKAQHYGTILLTRPFNHLVLTVVFVLIAGAIMVFLGRFETTRKTHCQGVLVPAAGMIRDHTATSRCHYRVARQGRPARQGW
jgi:hypothetical protein